ncbi:MAG: choice-of-anchor J domain-containing protein, partial [Planctomycetota bacterium]
SAMAQSLSEGFDVVDGLDPATATDGIIIAGTDWNGALRSDPLGTSGIFQGNPAVFPAHSGPDDSYLGMNFNNSGSPGQINTFAITPVITMNNGDTVSFYTRGPSNDFPDNLELRLSTNGASLDVGTGVNDVGDFSTLLVEIDPTLSGTFPVEWTQFSATISGLGGPTDGRLAFRYTVPDSGPLGANSNYIGIDTFDYQAVPEPAGVSLALMSILGLISVIRRR